MLAGERDGGWGGGKYKLPETEYEREYRNIERVEINYYLMKKNTYRIFHFFDYYCLV